YTPSSRTVAIRGEEGIRALDPHDRSGDPGIVAGGRGRDTCGRSTGPVEGIPPAEGELPTRGHRSRPSGDGLVHRVPRQPHRAPHPVGRSHRVRDTDGPGSPRGDRVRTGRSDVVHRVDG